MFSLINLGRHSIHLKNSNCRIITQNAAQRYTTKKSSIPNAWDFLKSKLGIQKKQNHRKGMVDSHHAEPHTVEIPVQSNSQDIMYKPGYRGRTENKRY